VCENDALVPESTRLARENDALVPESTRLARENDALVPESTRLARENDALVPDSIRFAWENDAVVPESTRLARRVPSSSSTRRPAAPILELDEHLKRSQDRHRRLHNAGIDGLEDPFCDARMLSRSLAFVLAALAACNRASDVPRAALDRFDAPPPVAALPDAARLEVSRDGPASFLPADASGAAAALSPIPADPLFTNLTIPGFPEAVVSVPNGATSPRPVIIVLHGSGDRPDWNCDAWRHITGARGFVLSLRGQYVPAESTKDDRRYTHRGGAYLRAHVGAALEALAARFVGYVDIEQPVVAGFSLGATEVAELAVGAPARFPRVALVEGGHGVWNDVTIRSFAGEDRRALFGCGSSWCVPSAKAAALRVAKGGAQARTVYANVGHTTDRPLQEAIMGELGWFLEGDLRWASAP
jgi:pimeloyl-ACP methyl ester carboxylesterase